jgi:hypothetical protein
MVLLARALLSIKKHLKLTDTIKNLKPTIKKKMMKIPL